MAFIQRDDAVPVLLCEPAQLVTHCIKLDIRVIIKANPNIGKQRDFFPGKQFFSVLF